MNFICEDGRHAVSKINRGVSMKIAKEDSKKCNIPAKREVEENQSEERR